MENNSNLIEKAKQYAMQMHKDQVDKANEDYYLAHVEVVAENVKNAGYPVEYIVTAYLHDVVEDTDATIEDISEKFGDGIANAVASLSKTKGEDYSNYIKRVQENKIATVVKYYDMEHNSDLSRLEKIREKDLKRKDKYLKHMAILGEDMGKINADLELKDLTSYYHTKMYILAEYSKLIWKRFNWFLAIEVGLLSLYFTKKSDISLITYIPYLGIFFAILWGLMGFQDQSTVQKHKKKGKRIENIIKYNFLNNKNIKSETFSEIKSQTNLLWIWLRKFIKVMYNFLTNKNIKSETFSKFKSQTNLLWILPSIFFVVWILVCLN
jgi:hypothetical protein